ncbi:uncharacterized protein BJ212DRAFT_1299401 [Suillus subaureus]|uniref:Uncharacterized protein n=1 Tax=Suillus subaureus TaxID=48587 RepID=A0A9P7ECC2_9AGAM|nr:uncharacterized protein BJ212DRAFT_1299401 [Suillus subaureus]KAG1817262.1 hypothetical protein BJ212DRAFT_1299401 [Suillus subaureus]
MTISTLQSLSVSASGSYLQNPLQAYHNSNGDSREPCRSNLHTSHHTTSGMSDILEVVDNFNAMSIRDPSDGEANLMMDLVRAKCKVFQAEKALADLILREHEVLSSLLRFQAETAGKRLDDADLGLGYMRVAFKRHSWTPHTQAPLPGQGCLHADSCDIVYMSKIYVVAFVSEIAVIESTTGQSLEETVTLHIYAYLPSNVVQECLDTAIFDVMGTSMDTIETDDSDGGNGGEDLREGEKLRFVFGGDKGVQAMRNKKIIDHAANIVWNEQNDCDAETCTLGHKDIIAFAKDKFLNLKDSSKRAKCQKQKVVNKRKKHYPSVIEAYTKEYGADLTLLLETEYMSEELSELETDNEEEKKAHHKILLQKAGFIGSDEEDAVVWEVFNDIMERINKIR